MIQDRHIPWLRIFTEGSAIVVSILLAFAIDAWWDDRKDRHEERKQLSAMRLEFQEGLVALDEILESIQRHAANVDEFINILKQAGDEPVTVPAQLLGSALQWRTSEVSTSTLNALMASGNLNSLSNEDLRASLAGFPAVLHDVAEDEALSRDFAENIMSVFLARQGLAEIAYANRQGFEGLNVRSEAIVTPSPEFIGMLAARRVHIWFTENGVPRLQSYLRDLIEQIDSELAKSN
jgi:hypothetical protein